MDDYGQLIEPPKVPFALGAPGWYIVGFLALAVLLFVAWLFYRHWRRNRYRKEALDWLATREQESVQPSQQAALVYDTNMLLKRIAVGNYGRKAAASLEGNQWIDLLNKTAKKQLFDQRDGEALQQWLYTNAQPQAGWPAMFLTKAKSWIQTHKRKHAF